MVTEIFHSDAHIFGSLRAFGRRPFVLLDMNPPTGQLRLVHILVSGFEVQQKEHVLMNKRFSNFCLHYVCWCPIGQHTSKIDSSPQFQGIEKQILTSQWQEQSPCRRVCMGRKESFYNLSYYLATAPVNSSRCYGLL